MKWIRFLLLTSIVFSLLGLQPQQALADTVLAPTDDTFVRDKDGQRDTNFDGDADELSVTAEGFPTGLVVDIGYLRFDLSAASETISAQLRLYNQAAPGTAVTVGLYSTADDDWNGGSAGLGDETSLTFNNAPAEVALLDSQTGAASAEWMVFGGPALTAYYNAQVLGDGLMTLRVKVTTTGMADVNVFEDRENGGGTGNTPELVVSDLTHTHWGETWSGIGTGLSIVSLDDNGIIAESTAPTGAHSAVFGDSLSERGHGIHGVASSAAGANYGVMGTSASTSGTGIYGSSGGTLGPVYGIYASVPADTGRAVYGVATAGAGVNYGVYGRSDSTQGRGVYAYAKGLTGNTAGIHGETNSPDGWAGYFYSAVGNGLYISVPPQYAGINVASGTKNAVVATAEGARLMYVEEATEVWFADYGTARLAGGVAEVPIDAVYGQTVNLDEPYHVFVQAYDDAELYVSERTAQGFRVQVRADAMSAGNPEATFYYRIVARRLGHEGKRLERAPWGDDDPNLYPEKRAPQAAPDVPPALSLAPRREVSPGAGRRAPNNLETGEAAESVPLPDGRVDSLVEMPLTALVDAHDHWGEWWGGNGTGLTLTSSDDTALIGQMTAPVGRLYGVYGQSKSPTGRGVVGSAEATSGVNYGVRGYSSNSHGLAGYVPKTVGPTTGVYGQSDSEDGRGVYGLAEVGTGKAYGVYGLSKSEQGTAVYGLGAATTGTSYGVCAQTDSPWGSAAVFANTTVGNGVYISVPAGKAGLNVASGTKNAVVATEDGARLLYAEEATEVWFSDYGFAQLQGGAVRVPIDDIYAQTVNLKEPYHVFLQAYGDVELVVGARTPQGFQVHARSGDQTALFGYRVVAKRLGHETKRLEPAPWAAEDPNLEAELAELDALETLLAPDPMGLDEALMEGEPTTAAEAAAAQAAAAADREGNTDLSVSAVPPHTHHGESWSGSGVGLELISTTKIGIIGQSNAASGDWAGVWGRSSSSTGTGVYGTTPAAGGPNFAVFGLSNSSSGTGVAGIATAPTGITYGAYGHTISTDGRGVVGFATATGGVHYSVWGETNSPQGCGVFGYSTATTGGPSGLFGKVRSPNGWAGKFTSVVGNGVYISVPAGKAGLNVASGTKNAVVATEDGARLMYAEEATEVWFSDYGFGRLVDGVAVVPVDALYAQTVDLEAEYHVSLQAYGDAQLYVSRRTADGFEVRARDGDADAEFSYRLVAKRAGYAEHRLARAPWADEDPNLYPDGPIQIRPDDSADVPSEVRPDEKPSPRTMNDRNP